MGKPLKLAPLTLEEWTQLLGKGEDYIHPELHISGEGELVAIYLQNYTCGVREDDRVIGAFGLTPTAPGVATVWLKATHQLRARPVSLYKLGRRLAAFAMSKFKLHRLECNVAADFDVAHNYVRENGFQFEGVRRSFRAPGEDFHLYARVSE
jgi:hypothetical protein